MTPLRSVFARSLGAATLTAALLSTLVSASASQLPTDMLQGRFAFEPNRGQFASSAEYIGRGPGYSIALSATEAAVLVAAQGPDVGGIIEIRMLLLGAGDAESIEAEDELPGRTHYYSGSTPETWVTDIRSFGRVRFTEVYEGIDVVYYSTDQGQLEYDFIIAPGIDPKVVGLAFAGAEGIRLVEGELAIDTRAGQLTLEPPFAYQDIDGERRAVEAAYVLDEEGDVRFELGAYDADYPLVIDPTLSYLSTDFGLGSRFVFGISSDRAHAVAALSSGEVYAVGGAFDPIFFTPSEAFVVKFDSQAALDWTAFFPANGVDVAYGIALDAAGNAYVAGETSSADFPNTGALPHGGGRDGFVLKLDPAGLLAGGFSTFLGGAFDDRADSVRLAANGELFVAGSMKSDIASFEDSGVSTSVWNTYLAKIDRDSGEIVFNTGRYVGRLAKDGTAVKMTTGPVSEVYLAGTTDQTEAFVVKVDATVTSSTISNSSNSPLEGTGIAYSSGSVYLTDSTAAEFAGTALGQQTAKRGGLDVYIMKLDAGGTPALNQQGHTYLGGDGDDEGHDIAVDTDGKLLVTGQTAVSTGAEFPLQAAAQSSRLGGIDAFLAKLTPGLLALDFSTFVSTSEQDYGLAVAGAQPLAYLAGYRTDGFRDHSYVAIHEESLGINSFTIDNCGTPATACLVSGSGPIEIATATVVLSGPLVVGDDLSLEETVLPPSTAFLSFGSQTPAAAGVDTYTFKVFSNNGLAPGQIISDIGVRAKLNDVYSLPQLVSLTGPANPITIIQSAFAVTACVVAACVEPVPSNTPPLAIAIIETSDPLSTEEVPLLFLTGGDGVRVTHPGPPQPVAVGESKYEIDIFLTQALLAGESETLNIQAHFGNSSSPVIEMELVGPPLVLQAAAVNLTQTVVTGPTTITGNTVQLNCLTAGSALVPTGLTTVYLTAVPTGVVTTPATVDVPGGSCLSGAFTIEVLVDVAAPVDVVISASLVPGTVEASATLRVNPRLKAKTVNLTQTVVSGPTTITGNTVQLNCLTGGSAPVPTGLTTVYLTAAPTGVVTTPATVDVPGGSCLSGAFTISVPAVALPVDIIISASLSATGPPQASATLRVNPPVFIFEAETVNLAETEVEGPATIEGNTVELNCTVGGPVPAGILTVYLTAVPSPVGFLMPATVSVPANSCLSETFTIEVPAVSAALDIVISASLEPVGPAQATATLKVNPPAALAILDFAVFGAGNRSNRNSTTIGRDVEVSGGLVGSNRKVVLRAASNVTGIRAGADVSVGRAAGRNAEDDDDDDDDDGDGDGDGDDDGDDGDDGDDDDDDGDDDDDSDDDADDDEDMLGLAKGIIAGGKVTLASRATVLGTVDGDQIRIRRNAAVGASVVVAGRIDLERDALIDGDADGTRASLGRNATITGTLTLPVGVNPTGSGIRNGSATIGEIVNGVPQTPKEFSAIVLPPASIYTPSGSRRDDVKVQRRRTLTLAPGVYRDLQLKKEATLNLGAGTYVFRKISGSDEVTLNMDATVGDIVILAARNVNLGDELRVNVVGGSAKDVYLETAGTFDTDKDSIWQGTVFSTKSSSAGRNGISIGRNNRLTGAFFSNQQVDLSDRTEVSGEIADAFVAKVTP